MQENSTNNTDNYKNTVLKQRFLDTLALDDVLGNVTVACRRTGIGRTTVYEWRAKDSAYEREWDDIVLSSNEKLADEAENQLQLLVLKGNVTAIIFTLKNRRRLNWYDKESDKSEPVDYSRSYEEYIQFCKRNGINPETGLRSEDTSSNLESQK